MFGFNKSSAPAFQNLTPAQFAEGLRQPGAVLVDVRRPDEFAAGHLPGAVNIPLADLRARMAGLPRDRTVLTYCGVGQRAYYAARALTQHGCTARLLPGGYETYRALVGSGALCG